jgi:hypothetical protein
VSVILAYIIGILIAIGHGATAIGTPPPDVQAIYQENGYTSDNPAEQKPIEVIVEYTAPGCGAMNDEPCYVIIYTDGTIEVGP